MYRGLPDKHLVWGDSMLNCLNRFTYIILMASNCYEHWPSRHCQVCCTIQFGLKNRAGGWVWCVDGLGRVRANDDIIARCREWEETITLLSGMLARTVQVRSPVTPGPVSCSGSRHGARVLREQLITASRPGPRLPGLVLTRVWPVRGKIDLDCETGRGGARKRDGAGRRGGALACKESAGPS